MYSLDEFGEMVGDTLRFPAYREAIARAVKPGDSVVDIGSGPWKSVPGLNLEVAMPVVLNTMYKRQCKPEQLLSDAQAWHVLDYPNGADPRAGAKLRFHTNRSGTAHGFTVWFATKLYEDIGFCTKPGTKDSVYGQVFLPLLEPVAVSAGEEIH